MPLRNVFHIHGILRRISPFNFFSNGDQRGTSSLSTFTCWKWYLTKYCNFQMMGNWMQEIYSIKLPGEVILGEGKPENQNHAIVFTRGEALQTIDMNQVCLTCSVILCRLIIFWALLLYDIHEVKIFVEYLHNIYTNLVVFERRGVSSCLFAP